MTSPNILKPTIKQLRRIGGRSKITDALTAPPMDMFYHKEDFIGDLPAGGAIPGQFTATTTTNGTFAYSVTAANANGVARFDTGASATDNDVYILYLPTVMQGQLCANIAVRLSHVTAITARKIEVGFMDATQVASGCMMNNKGGPTYSATDGACWAFDTDTDAYLGMYGVKNSTGATAITTTQTPAAAATYETFQVSLQGTSAKFIKYDANGAMLYESIWMSDAVTATAVLYPYVALQTRSAAEIYLDVDYIALWQWRTTGY
jgi:hypothetical protein